MRHTLTYQKLTRLLWLLLAINLVIFWGPVKKMVEVRVGVTDMASLLTIDKKLKTYYREKRDIPPLVYTEVHSQPDTDPGIALFLTSSFIVLSLLLLRKNYYVQSQYAHPVFVPAVARYLHLRKIQV